MLLTSKLSSGKSSKLPNQERNPSTAASNPRNAIKLAPIFSTSGIADETPTKAASMKFLCSLLTKID